MTRQMCRGGEEAELTVDATRISDDQVFITVINDNNEMP